jgi:hypothetical protein
MRATGMAAAEPPSASPAGGRTSPATISATRTSIAPQPSCGRTLPSPHTSPAPISGGNSA